MSERSNVDGRYWFPLGARRHYGKPETGQLVAFDHQAWHVVEVRDLDETAQPEPVPGDPAFPPPIRRPARKPYVIHLRPARLANHPDPVKAKAQDRHLRAPAYYSWNVYPDPEHYPVCACCAEPMPCRDEAGRKMAERAIQEMGRYETAGVCPACTQRVTHRQKSMTFEDNLNVIGGPPVTFHLRGKCWQFAYDYEKRWAAAAPGRHCALSCSGNLTNHNDDTYECTDSDTCPGPSAHHVSAAICACRPCHARPWTSGRGCIPAPTARLRRLADGEEPAHADYRQERLL